MPSFPSKIGHKHYWTRTLIGQNMSKQDHMESIICAYGENRGVKRVYMQYIQKGDSSIKHIYKFQAPWCTLLLNITKPCPKQWLEAQTIQPRRIPPVLASQAAKCKSHATLLIGKRLVARTLQRQSSAAPGGGWWWWWLVQERKQSTPVWYLLHSSNISHLWKRKLFPITFGGAKSCRKKEGFSVYQLVIAWSSNPGEERTLHTTRSARW